MCLCAHISTPYSVHSMYVLAHARGHTCVCLYLVHVFVSVSPRSSVCFIVRMCQCVLAEFQVLGRQQQDTQFQCQVTQCPLIPHNPPCLQAGDPCVFVWVHMCMSLCQALLWWHHCGYTHNALETHFPHQAVTSQGNQKAKPVTTLLKPYHVLCLSLGGIWLLNIKTRPLC